MNQALEIIYYIFDKAVNLVFNQMQLVNGVFLGWVLMFIIIAGILIGSLLAVPHASETVSKYRNDVRRGKFESYQKYRDYYYSHRR